MPCVICCMFYTVLYALYFQAMLSFQQETEMIQQARLEKNQSCYQSMYNE
jgi:hypothetical protein